MGAFVMVLPPANPDIRVAGLPIRLFAEDVLRRARAARVAHAPPSAPAAPPAPKGAPSPIEPVRPAEPAPVAATAVIDTPTARAVPVGTGALTRTLREFTLLDLYVEARRSASEAALQHEHLEGLAAGRTYGDVRLQPGFLTPECYRLAAIEAKRRAEMAGATADFLRAMLGHEGALTDLLTGGERD